MKLTHYSHKTVQRVYSVGQDSWLFKPNGLWVSCDDFSPNWREYCVGVDDIRALTHVHDVTLTEGANILRLQNATDIDKFTATYANGYCRIDWHDIAAQYQGIIIAPFIYQRQRAKHTPWYYSWDCASGCIWDATAISSITLTEVFRTGEEWKAFYATQKEKSSG